jgi:voltage-gated potassium channel Kch
VSATSTTTQPESHAYDLFILVLTLLSLLVMLGIVVPTSDATTQLLEVYDNMICVVFLIDFTWRITKAPSKRGYFIGERGWLDLLGSIPNFGVTKYIALLRLARLSRLARVSKLLRPEDRAVLANDLIRNRGQYAVFITLMSGFTVLVVASIFILQAESKSPDANITTGGDALWWGIVTITTVGYGDKYPVTGLGRLIATFVMFAGVGIIGSLASILASLLVPTAQEQAEATADVDRPAAAAVEPGLGDELAALRQEIAALRRALPPPTSGATTS